MSDTLTVQDLLCPCYVDSIGLLADPATQLEKSGYTNLTTLENELTFYKEVTEAAVNHFEYEIVGYSVQNRPLYKVIIGQGETSIYYLGLQHGNEPAGREGILAFIRDLAVSEEENIQSFLGERSVVFLPTMNPDGWPNARENANGVDLNRNWMLESEQPESLINAGIIRDYKPKIILDAHEMLTSTHDLEFDLSDNPNQTTTMRNITQAILLEYVQPYLSGAGYGSGWYNSSLTSVYHARNNSTNHHALGILFESTNRGDFSVIETRMKTHQIGCKAIFDYYVDNKGELENEIESRVNYHKTNDGSVFVSGDYDNPGNELNPPPYGYKLTEIQYNNISHLVEYFDFAVTVDGDDYYVDFKDRSRLSVAYALDQASDVPALEEGVRITEEQDWHYHIVYADNSTCAYSVDSIPQLIVNIGANNLDSSFLVPEVDHLIVNLEMATILHPYSVDAIPAMQQSAIRPHNSILKFDFPIKDKQWAS